mgnify:CR=1 FL=1
MAAYVIAEIEVLDPARYEEYRREVAATVTAHGGRFIVRGGAIEVLEGDDRPQRIVILEFPDMDTAQRWYGSVPYQPLIALRQAASRGRLLLVEGV